MHAQSHWQTAIFSDDIWKYVVPDTELNSIWNTIEFDDSNWLEGQGGFGYGDSDDGTLLDQAISVYFRKSFNISIYDVMGSVVRTLVNGSQTAGYNSIQWNAMNDQNEQVSAGLYLYTIKMGEFRQTKKMVLLK